MASIRRTLSHSTRPWPPIQDHSPTLSSSSSSSSLMAFGRILFPSSRRSSSPSWKSSAVRYFLFFLLGFLLGFFPFADLAVDVVAPHDFAFEIQSPVLEDSGRDRDLVVVKQGHRVMETVEAGSAKHVTLESSREAAGVGEEWVGVGGRKLLIVVTPTYNRALQAYYLARLGHTLRLVPPPLLWVVVEMSAASTETADVLRRTGVMYRHLVCKKNSSEDKDRGVHQRNAALEHIERHRMDGIVYFADDDNIYSLELFDRMREVRRFGTWPVAMLAKSKNKAIMEGPVCNESQIIGWHTNEKSKRLRRFHVDMSGFAFNSTILWDPKRWHRPTSDIVRQLDTLKEGFQETTFIQQVVEDEFQMEAIPSGCSKILTWHLHLDSRGLFYPRGWRLLKNLETVIPI